MRRPLPRRRLFQRSPEEQARIERAIARQVRAQKDQAEAQMLGFDALPAPVRAAMAGMVTAYPALTARSAIGEFTRAGLTYEQAVEVLPAALAQRDEDDVQKHSAEMRRRLGRPSAHVAAGASILRPHAGEPRRGRRSPV